MAVIQYPEPTWGTCQPVEEPCSSLVTTGITPYILKGIVLQLLRFHFGDCDNITNPALKGYIWCGDNRDQSHCDNLDNGDGDDGGSVAPGVPHCDEDSDNGTGACATGPIIEPDPDNPDSQPRYPEPVGEGCSLFIGGSGDLNLGQVGQRPGIFVHLGETVNERVTNLKGSSYPAAKNAITGQVDGSKHANRIQGVINIIVVDTTQTSTELLAEEVFYNMLHYAPIIQDKFRIGRFSCTNLKESTKLTAGEQSTAWQRVVNIKWAHIHTWALKQEAPLLKRFYTNKLACKQDIGE
jgi:hypothetical protein